MKEAGRPPGGGDWRCGKCGEVLVTTSVRIRYLETTFSTDLPACPRCGKVMVAEEDATGKMAEAEHVLEDK